MNLLLECRTYVFQIGDDCDYHYDYCYELMLQRDMHSIYPVILFYIKAFIDEDWMFCYSLTVEKQFNKVFDTQQFDWDNESHIQLLLDKFKEDDLDIMLKFYDSRRELLEEMAVKKKETGSYYGVIH